MDNKLTFADLSVFVIYFLFVSGYGYWIYKREKKGDTTKEFFLAAGELTWWAIGASLIASNISAEQFIGMSGEGFFAGIAVSAYEWVAAIALIIVAVWFMPIYLQNKIYTMPQFLKTRYNEQVAFIMAVFWLFLYVCVNLTSILYLGSKAISGLLGGDAYLHAVMLGLALFAFVITIGGMKVIGYTDVVQVMVLTIGGLATTYFALIVVSEKFGLGNSAIAGFNTLMKEAPEHFHMIFAKPAARSGTEYVQKYVALPGIAMYAAGQWIANLNYWGCNQYITQRALGANLKTARTGILFAAFLKIMMPVIVMLPGIAAFVLYKNGLLPQLVNGNKDGAYAAILGFLPAGLRGLSLAALTAAIVASLAGKANSISTIFTLDIYNRHLDKNAGEQKQVWVGRITVFVAFCCSILFTWRDLFGIGGEGGFTFIQKYTGYISPGVFAMFLLGMFWKRTTGAAAVVGVITGFLLSVFFNEAAPAVLGNNTLLYTAYDVGGGKYLIPFLVCMGLSFVFTVLVMVVVSLAGPKEQRKGLEMHKGMFRINNSMKILIVAIVLILAALYVKFW